MGQTRAMGLMERDSEEWRRAWALLWTRWGSADNPDERDPDTGESWQYLVSVSVDGGPWVHEFRHRRHPRLKTRVYQNVGASRDWAPGQVS